MQSIEQLNQAVIRCGRCPRLVQWRRRVSRKPPPRYAGASYWGRALPGVGDPDAQLLIVGLAPAANGGNRTGRMFTGDRSGEWLYRALYTFGFSNQPISEHNQDGLRLNGCYITAAVRCAPPANKPTPEEFKKCRSYLIHELHLLKNIRVVVALGKMAFDSFLTAYRVTGRPLLRPYPRFIHGMMTSLDSFTLLASYHPSQQNTFTGRLTQPMFHDVFKSARSLVDSGGAPAIKAERGGK